MKPPAGPVSLRLRADAMIQINQNLAIPEEELEFCASRSQGPGGQNVNKVNTRVTLSFHVEGSSALDEAQKATLRKQLANRISKEDRLLLSCQSSRSQAANRREVEERFAALLEQALRPRKKRRRRRIPQAVKARRLEEKRKKARLKEARRRVEP